MGPAKYQDDVDATVLILAADPDDRYRLRVDREIRSIQESLRGARRRFRVEISSAARQEDARRSVLDHRPQIVHFCGHGTPNHGLLFEGRNDQPQVVDPAALKQFFEALGESVRCLVLSACYSADLAALLVGHIDHVIGMDGEIEETTATEFATAFYDALGADGDVIEAHQAGLAAIAWGKLPGEQKPIRRSRESAAGIILGQRPTFGPWTVPLAANPYFTGREDTLREIHRRLTSGGASAIPVEVTQGITGPGGVGKTQTVIQYCLRHRREYPMGVLWVRAESASSLTEGYFAMARTLGLTSEGTTPEEGCELFIRWLNSHVGWLLVLDNADEPEVLKSFWPTGGFGHTLVTSRSSSFPFTSIRNPIRLDVLTEAGSVALLEKRVERPLEGSERGAAEDLARELGHLPLALEQAGAYSMGRQWRLDSYLKAWRGAHDQGKLPGEQPFPPVDYSETVATTWRMSFERVLETHPASADILRIAAFLAPDNVPMELFIDAAEHLGPNLERLAGQFDESLESKLLEPLIEYSLIHRNVDERTFRLHRLAQTAVRTSLDEGESSYWMARTVDGLLAIYPPQTQDIQAWPQCRRLNPHTEALFRIALNSDEETVSAAALWTRAGSFASSQGQHPLSRDLHGKALDIRRRLLGKEHPETLTAMSNLAAALQKLGDTRGAWEVNEKTLEARQRILGEGHEDTLISMMWEARLLFADEKMEEAAEKQRAVLEAQRHLLGEDHPHTLKSMTGLAVILFQMGDIRGAREIEDRALASSRRTLGDDHKATLVLMHNLSLVLEELGDLQGSRDLLKQAADGFERTLGREHPTTRKVTGTLQRVDRALDEA